MKIGLGSTATNEDSKKITIQIPTENFTTSGKLVQRTYILSCKGEMEGSMRCCSDNLEVKFPISIFPKLEIEYAPIVAPSNWNPQAMSAIVNPSAVYVKSPDPPSQLQTIGNVVSEKDVHVPEYSHLLANKQ